MTTSTTAIDHADRRLVVALPRPYDEARAHYETLVPHADSARFSQMGSWLATQELAEINAPHGFMIYYRNDVTAAMAGSPSTSPACCSPATATPGSPTSATNSTPSSPGSSSCSAVTCPRNWQP